jgi:AcrR family transcriptional regulator
MAVDPSETIEAERRAPFGSSPSVGPRGRSTQQRLLVAALELFDESGYHRTSVEAITSRAGCSRPTLYQYFGSKEDLFRRLAGQLGEELASLTSDLGPVDAGLSGRSALCDWLDQLVEVHSRYRPIAQAFAASLRRDPAMVTGAAELHHRYRVALAEAISRPLPSEVPIDALAGIAMVTAYDASTFRSQLGQRVARARFIERLTDAVHRCFYGPLPGINLGPDPGHDRGPPSQRRIGRPDSNGSKLRPKGERTRARLLDAARSDFARLGYHATRVDDIAATAGLSHGAFYRYFEDKEQVFREVALAAAADTIELIEELPDPPGGLAAWCTRYYATYELHGALFGMWPEASEAGVEAAEEVSQAVLSTLQAVLAHRPFGDVDVDAVVLFALLDGGPQSTFAFAALSTDEAAAATHIFLARSLLGKVDE